jgi:hypothetical protein
LDWNAPWFVIGFDFSVALGDSRSWHLEFLGIDLNFFSRMEVRWMLGLTPFGFCKVLPVVGESSSRATSEEL